MTAPHPTLEDRLAQATARPALWLGVMAALLCTQISAYWYPAPDSVCYLSMARSLAQGQGMRNLGSTQWIYAPGYPLLAAPAFWFSARPFLLLSILQWGLAIVFMLGVHQWIKRLTPPAALLLTGATVLHASFWITCRPTLSDTAFMAVMIWGVNALNHSYDARTPWALLRWAAVGALGMALLTLIRPAGLTIALGLGLLMLHKARRQSAGIRWAALGAAAAVVLAAGTVVGLLAWREQTTSLLTGHTNNYRSFRALADQFGATWSQTLQTRVSDIGRVLVPGMFKAYSKTYSWLDINMLVYVPLALVVLAGWVGWVRRSADALLWALPCYLALHLGWSLDQGARYFVPLIPVFLLCLWIRLEHWPRHRLSILAVLLVLHLSVAVGHWWTHELPQERQIAAAWPAAEQMAARIAAAPASISAADSAKPLLPLVAFLLDRPVDWTGQTPATHWLLTAAPAAVPPGFAVRLDQNGYELLERMTPAPAPSVSHRR